MKAKLKKDATITATYPSGYFWKIDDTFIFTDTSANGIPIYDKDEKKLYFLENHELSGLGFPEDMFEIIKENES